MIARTVFWASGAAIVHAVAGLPALVLARARLAARPHLTGDDTPRVSLLIAAYNEAADLPDKLRNVCALDYPADRLEIIVASDGSSDDTVAAARAAGGSRVTVLDLPRTGKAGALNRGMRHATGEIVVFTDANSMLVPQALRQLVAPFADPEVGGVAGNQVYTDAPDGDDAVDGERAHWALDRMLKTAATRSGSIVSATGALYAMRRELVPTVIDGVTDDFYVSTNAIAEGHRLVFAPEAVVHEPVAATVDDEYARKERVMTRGFRSVLARKSLLHPRHGFYAIQLFSYKVLRRLLAVPVAALGVAALALRRQGSVYAAVAAAQAVFWTLAGLGHALRRHPLGRSRILALPSFVAMNLWLSVRAAWRVVSGTEITQWTPARPAVDADIDLTERATVAAGAGGAP